MNTRRISVSSQQDRKIDKDQFLNNRIDSSKVRFLKVLEICEVGGLTEDCVDVVAR